MSEQDLESKFSEEDIAEITERVISRIEDNEMLSLRLATTVVSTLARNPDLGADLIEALEDQFPQSVLSGDKIIEAYQKGFLVIDPFDPDRVQTSSYDLAMGENFWTTREHPGKGLINQYDSEDIKRHWKGPWKALTVMEHLDPKVGPFADELDADFFRGFRAGDRLVILRPGETILAHTEEFIGGRDKYTTMMKARSSAGRIFLSVCKDAGWGDVGYFNRWTMEIQNNNPHSWTPVMVGQPIAQMIFFRVNPVEGQQYSGSGHYQDSEKVEDLKASWTADRMLPTFKRV